MFTQKALLTLNALVESYLLCLTNSLLNVGENECLEFWLCSTYKTSTCSTASFRLDEVAHKMASQHDTSLHDRSTLPLAHRVRRRMENDWARSQPELSHCVLTNVHTDSVRRDNWDMAVVGSFSIGHRFWLTYPLEQPPWLQIYERCQEHRPLYWPNGQCCNTTNVLDT